MEVEIEKILQNKFFFATLNVRIYVPEFGQPLLE